MKGRAGVVLALVLLATSCRPPQQIRRSEARISRRTALALLREAALRAGGNEVWVKGSAEGEFPPRRGAWPIEVLAEPSAVRPVSRALEHEAAHRGLQVKSSLLRPAQGEPMIVIRIKEGRLWETEWRVREVPRLLRVAIIIDDLGANEQAARELVALPYSLTFSVLPRLRYSVETADIAFHAGREVMLHLPMQPIPRPGIRGSPEEIRVGMSARVVERLVESDLEAVPHIRGVDNHQGSLATSDPVLMADVMRVLAGRHLYFVDSRTIGSSVAWEAARKAGVPAAFRSVFLDDRQTVPYTLGQLRELEKVVERQGVAIAIGHPHPTTIRALKEFLPRLAEADVQLVPVSYLFRLPETSRLYPPRPVRPAMARRRASPHSAAGGKRKR